MASAFAQQLRQIAVHSTNELDLKARRNAHAESLLFERDDAVKQDWDTLFQICVEGFQELNTLDTRFREFENNLFSSTSRSQDREQMNKSQNEDLDATILRCLQLLGPRLSLRPGLRALEWLIRRFRVHVYNINHLLLTVLRYHEKPLFQNTLDLIPVSRLVDQWKFLRPYHNSSTPLPRHTIVYTATTNEGLFSVLNEYTLQTCRTRLSESGLMQFWESVVVEAVAGRLKQAQSGRFEVQQQRTEDILHQVLPLLNEGMSVNLSTDLTMTSFALALVLATTDILSDEVIDSLLEAVSRASQFPGIEEQAALTVLVLLSARKQSIGVPKKVVRRISQLSTVLDSFSTISKQYSCQAFFKGVVQTSLRSMKQEKYEDKLDLVGRLLRAGLSLQTSGEFAQLLLTVVIEIQRLEQGRTTERHIRVRLIQLLRHLYELDNSGPAFSELAALCTHHGVDLESLLQVTVLSLPTVEPSTSIEDRGSPEPDSDVLENALASIPTQAPAGLDFASPTEPQVFRSLREVLGSCNGEESKLSLFQALPLWTSLDSDGSQYLTCLLRLLFSNTPTRGRIDAASLLLAKLTASPHDAHSLLPYLSVLLADDVPTVRRMAAAMLASSNTGLDTKREQSGSRILPGRSSALSPGKMKKIISQLYSPFVEEYVSDEKQIGRTLQHAFNGNLDQLARPATGESIELQKTLRQAMLEDFASSAVHTPFLRFQIGMVDILHGVTGVGSLIKIQILAPVFKLWAAQSDAAARSWALKEALELPRIDAAMASLLTGHEKTSITQTLDFVLFMKDSVREQLVAAIFDHFNEVWSTLSDENEEVLARKLFDVALQNSSPLATSAKAVLQQVTLRGDTLQMLLSSALSVSSETQEQPPTKKRRTSSHSGGKAAPLAGMLRQSLPSLTLALDLVEGSKPENHAELLPTLTETLLHLRRIKDKFQLESPYLLSTCLGSMLAIVEKLKAARRPSIDWNSIRADLIADCVRTSESPQVQTQALLLSASLSSIAPDKVIHHIMPVFTFMGKKLLSQTNQHTVHVINEAIDCIVPPLVAALRKQDANNLLKSTRNVLSSFVASFDHIPQQRKIPLFQRLLRQLGPAEFGFAIVAMLENSKAARNGLPAFIAKVFAAFPIEVYLSTFRNLVILAQDCLAQDPHDAETLLEVTKSVSLDSRKITAFKMLANARSLITDLGLKSQAVKWHKQSSDARVGLENLFRSCLLQTLETRKELLGEGVDLRHALEGCLIGLLDLVAVEQLIDSLLVLFADDAEIGPDIMAQAVELLSTKIGQKGNTQVETALAALDYLAQLEDMLSTTSDVKLSYAAIRCIDQICTKYGRRDAMRLMSTAHTLTGESGINSSNDTIRILAAHALGSLVLILGEGAVSLKPEALQGALGMIEKSTASDSLNPMLHNAAFGLLKSLVQSIWFVWSEEDISSLIVAAGESAFSDLPKDCASLRKEALTEVAQRVDLKALLQSLSSARGKIIDYELEGITVALDLLNAALDHHEKTAVVQSADEISSYLLKLLDLRRSQATAEIELDIEADEINMLEDKVGQVSLKFIYKLSDGVFRPIFESWVAWATHPRDLNEVTDALPAHILLRQISLYNFLAQFFSTLKSIVTSYASLVLKPANDALDEFHKHESTHPNALTHYSSLLNALSEILKHDTENTFAAPGYFEPLARNLVSQIDLAANKQFRPLIFQQLLPAIVALATAVEDTPSCHHAINHYLAQRRHANSQYVRLASIRTHLALTEDEDIGDEWVNNVVSGTVSADAPIGSEGTDAGGRAGFGGSGETMIYVNEMLEDDDEEVEREVRRWVRMVREKVGEDVFST